MNLKNLFEKLDSHSNIKAEKMIEILSAEQLSDEDILYIIENYKKIHNLRFILVIKYLVARVENVKIMVKIIKLIEYSGYKLELVTKLPDNEKMQFLDERKEYFDQDEILNTIEDQGVLIDYLSSSSSDRIREFTKALIISRLKNDGLKLEYLDKIKVENNKALIISTLLDDQVKLKLLQEMKSNKARAIIYSSLREKRNIDEIPIPIKKKYNKIGLPDNMTFGIEIESEGSAYKYFYDMETVINDWISKKDMSLENGIEIVSPPLYDRSESVSDIYTINSLLSQAGMFTNYNCGGHIHIGADYLTSIESYVNLLELYCNCEKIIYLISNKEDDIIDKDRIESFCMILSLKIAKAIEKGELSPEEVKSKDEFIKQINVAQVKRNRGINFRNIGDEDNNTIEFRIPNGTLDPNTWIENIRLFGRLMQVSEELTHNQNSPEILGKLELKQKLKNPNLSEEDRLEILLEILFKEEERDIYRKRYNVNSEKVKELDDYDNPFFLVDFPIVNFDKSDFAEVAENTPVKEVDGIVEETKDALGFGKGNSEYGGR